MPMKPELKRSLLALCATMALLSGSDRGASATGAPLMVSSQDSDGLLRLLQDSRNALTAHGEAARLREGEEWIARLREAIDSVSSDDPMVAIITLRIGEILEGLGAFEEAIAEYRGVSDAFTGSGMHHDALLSSIRAASAEDDEPHRPLAFADAFEREVGTALRRGQEVWPQHQRAFDNLLMLRSNILATSAQRIGRRPRDAADPREMGFYLVRAGDLLEAWVISRGSIAGSEQAAAERIRAASYFLEAGPLLARSDEPASAQSAHLAASALLEYALADAWSGRLQHHAAALQLKNLFAIHEATERYLEEAARVLAAAAPGHEALSYLRDLGNILSGRPQTLLIADGVLQLVVDTEALWFPNEFQRHVNYQWSRIEQGRIALALGDVARARRIAEEVEALPLEGEVLNGWRDDVRAAVERRSATAPTALVESDNAPEIDLAESDAAGAADRRQQRDAGGEEAVESAVALEPLAELRNVDASGAMEVASGPAGAEAPRQAAVDEHAGGALSPREGWRGRWWWVGAIGAAAVMVAGAVVARRAGRVV